MKDWKYVLSSAIIAPKTAPILLHGSLEECLKNAARLGYNGVEYHTRENAELDYEKIASVMEEENVRVSAIITGRLFTEGGYSLLNDDEVNSKTAMEGMLKYADMASKVRSDMVLGWAKGNVPAGADRKVYLDRLGGQLREIEKYSAERNVKILIEVINRYETNLFNTAEELLDFIDTQKLSNCYVHLDTFHMNIEEADMLRAIKISGDRLGYFHLADNTRWYPGHGVLDFKKIIGALEEVNYNGYLSVECLPNPDGETAAAIARKNLLAWIGK